tara:strand:+ start:3398 stop:3961 length:564 start_codon:yes stop_codon:yes gene_type:complete
MNQFQITNLPLRDAKIFKKKKSSDDRGFLSRLYCYDEFIDNKVNYKIKQINLTLTKKKATIRGLHYQNPPHAEIKFVTCLKGEIFDVIIDLRKGSPTFLKFHAEILSEQNQKSLLIPKGFAHGFQSLKNNSELLYFHTENYMPTYENGINYQDKKININWPLKVSLISKRDQSLPNISDDFFGIEIK